MKNPFKSAPCGVQLSFVPTGINTHLPLAVGHMQMCRSCAWFARAERKVFICWESRVLSLELARASLCFNHSAINEELIIAENPKSPEQISSLKNNLNK